MEKAERVKGRSYVQRCAVPDADAGESSRRIAAQSKAASHCGLSVRGGRFADERKSHARTPSRRVRASRRTTGQCHGARPTAAARTGGSGPHRPRPVTPCCNVACALRGRPHGAVSATPRPACPQQQREVTDRCRTGRARHPVEHSRVLEGCSHWSRRGEGATECAPPAVPRAPQKSSRWLRSCGWRRRHRPQRESTCGAAPCLDALL